MVEHDCNGEGFICFSQKDAILIGCMLAMFAESTLNEKVASLDFCEEEFDAFGEVCNQLISLIDQALVELLPQKIHLKQTNTQLLADESAVQEVLGKFKKEKYLINFPFKLRLKSIYKADINLILPASLISQMAGGEIELSQNVDSGQKKCKESSQDIVAASPSDNIKVLLINLAAGTDSNLEPLFEEKKIYYDYVKNIAQLKEKILNNPIKLIVIQSNGQPAKGVEFCSKLNRILGQSTMPIWLQSSNWDMDLIERSLKSGASYLIVMPVDPEIIRKKIQQLF